MMFEVIPNGWAASSIGEVAEYINGRAFKPSEWKSEGRPIIRIQNLNDEEARYNFSSAQHEEKYLVKKGDLLFAWSASLGVHIWQGDDAWLNQHIFNIKVHNCTTKGFLYYLLNKFTRELYAKAHGSGMVHVTKGVFESTRICLPPLAEQTRIVAKLEELFSELDKGVENLRTAQQQLKVYRQALLKHAFEGKLTAEWRAQNPDKLESAEALLARIQQEREARYQQQLAEWQAAQQAWEASGKTGSKPAKPKAPKVLPALTAEELAGLPELPEGWCWIKLGQIVSSVKDGPHFSPKYTEDGIPFISGGNVRPNGVDFSSAKKISPELHEELCKRCKPEVGDILYTKGGTTGIARVNTYNFEFNVWVHVAVLKPLDSIKSFYLQHALNSEFCYAQARKYTHGVGNQDLGLTRMVEIILPICSEREQERLVELVDDKISVIDQIENTITTSLRQAEAMRQSILKKAFSGQLVPQNPDDEPASVLLARIRAERDAQQPATRRGRPRRAEA